MRSIGGSLTAIEVGHFIYILFGVGLTYDDSLYNQSSLKIIQKLVPVYIISRIK